ncbi:MAG: hypothetical protein Q8Q60_02430 [Candidatus Chromulinivorax sp.]|nr:hypothetical protein [Candidatus Chromulinivorax sp.]
MNFKSIVMCLALISYDTFVQAVSFTKTRDEEIAELVENICRNNPDRKKEDLYAQVHSSGIGSQFVPISEIIWQEGETDNQFYLETSVLAQDASDTFNQLKIIMDIPDEVELWVENMHNDRPIHYNHIYRRVEILPGFFRYPPSARLFMFLHEFTHVQQHLKDGLLLFVYNNRSHNRFEYERQADVTAAQAISCPICMQVIEDDVFLAELLEKKEHVQVNRNAQGYMSSVEIEKYKSEKKLSDVCQAHARNNQPNQELKDFMNNNEHSETFFARLFHLKDTQIQTEEQSEAHEALDVQSSKFMQDRLSSVKIK